MTDADVDADDYEALRHGVGSLALGREMVRVAGPDARDYLQGQCSQDIGALTAGSSADALLLTPQGKLDALVRITRAADDAFYVDVDAGYGPAVVARLARFKLRVKADITTPEWTCVSLRGPAATDVAGGASPAPGTSLAVAFAWGDVVGVDLFGVGPQIPSGVRSCGRAAWESLRIEAGICVMGAELDGRTIAAEAGLLERAVSFTKGCYTGQELVARLEARGNKVARRLRGLVFDPSVDLSDTSAPNVIPGADVAIGPRVVGRVTSVAWSPTLQSSVALAYLHRDVAVPSLVHVAADGVGPDAVAAQARALPLVG